ncbi:hypothetical protein SAMN05519103_06507 [Rhizobiales bacterium GAS113]|nr:hypothetical protein SAMN05519103_06507 [Rhizobiales bacterium GAS113]
MTRVTLAVNIVPLDPTDTTGLRVSFQAGPQAGKSGQRMGMEIVIAPIGVPVGTPFNGWTIAEGLQRLGALFHIDAIAQIGRLQPPAPWDKLFNAVQISPSLRLQPTGQNPSVNLELQLFESGQPHDTGVTIGGDLGHGIRVDPEITVYALVAGYAKGRGLDLKARVLFHNSDNQLASRDLARRDLARRDLARRGLARRDLALLDAPAGKPQLVSYPFPLPDQNASSSFKLNFLGLGQRFAPTIDLNATDPLKSAFDALEKTFTSDDPTTILNTLVKDYYKPEVGWFFALDLFVRGFTVRAVLADPVLYGLEITCDTEPFKGLLAEILYQKIGSDLGVFYGKIILPDNIRQIQVGAGSATIPSFQLWIYTNGDFKIAIGWPLGPDSFSLQVFIFMGEAGLYFGKLRSGDNPTGRNTPQVQYNPILVLGLALKVGIGRSVSKGPISAEASLTLQGVFQGLLAWKAAGAQGETGIAHEPDYYWFSASVTLAGVVQGSVDLGIISATVCITVWANIATAFETNCNTVVDASVGVEVEVSVHIVFFTIHIHFSATLDLSFTLIGGHSVTAALDGPSDPNLRAFIPNPQLALRALPALRSLARTRDRLADAAGPTTVNLSFILQPAVPYDGAGAGQIGAVATLLIPCPDVNSPNPVSGSDFEVLADLVTPWLMSAWGGSDQTWKAVAAALGAGGQPTPSNFENGLSGVLRGVTFEITGVDLSKTGQPPVIAAIFPMLDPLALTVGGNSWTFGTNPLTYSGYPAALAAYFAALSALTPKPPSLRATARARATAPDGPSLSHLVYVNWFLAMARQIASAMADAEKAHGGTLPPGTLPSTKALATIASMLSRLALHGTRLPDPAVVHGPSDPISEAIIHPLYSLEHQQFTGTAGAAIQASLSLAGTGGPSIRFASGTSAVAILPAASVPAEPNPGWRAGSDSAPGIAVAPMDALTQGPLSIAATARTQGPVELFPGRTSAPDSQVLTVPASAVSLIAKGGLTGVLRVQPDTTAAATPFAPGLLIPLSLRRVPVTAASDLQPAASGGTPTQTPRWCTDVYELIGTDDDTRALLEKALDDPSFAVRRVVPLTLRSNVLTADTLDLTAQPVLVFKSNLSTTSQPNMLAAPILLLKRVTANADLGPVAAPLGDARAFLRLVWEASVVHTSGFYLRYADAKGNGLPDALFQKDVARFWLWLDLGDAPTGGTPLRAYANSMVIADTGNEAKSTQYLSLNDASGPVINWRPAFPPGCVGAELIWNAPPAGDSTPYSPASIAALYHMIELQIGGATGAYAETLWSTALSPVIQAKSDGGAILSATYKQVVPVWRYLATPSTNPYAAVGDAADLNFRLSDVYGNVLTDPTRRFAAPFPVVYNDPLLAPSSWPGCQVAYDLGKDANGAPALSVIISFNPAGLQSHAAKLRASLENGAMLADQSLQSARETWTTVTQQAHDANFQATVSSTLYGDPAAGDVWPTVGDPASALTQLRAAVDLLNAVVQGPNPAKASATITLPLDLTKVAARPSDIFPLGARLTLARQNVDQGVSKRLPAVARVDALLPPHLPPPADPNAPPPRSPVPPPLVAWTRGVEALLAGFDGKAGRVKLAQRPMSAADDAGAGPGLWAVRLSATAGISVGRQDPKVTKPAFFTLRPFSTSLQYGQTEITTWDANLTPTTATSSAASVDADVLAQTFLSSFDRLMAPDLAAGIARIGGSKPGAFDTLMADKATVASVLSQRLVPVYADQPAGDLKEAATQFEQSLLAQLSNAYATAAVAQIPLEVMVAGAAEAGAALPPRLYGGLGTGTAPKDGAPFTLTSPKLALDGGASSKPWLTFLVTVKQPEQQNILTLNPVWSISHIEHDFEPGEKLYGYLPSGWLKFVSPDADAGSPLEVSLGEVDVPVPLRRYPAPPVLVSQTAALPPAAKLAALSSDDPIQDMIRAALLWPFTLTIGKAEQAAQDDLWVTSTFNQPIDWQPTTAAGPGPLTPLTKALLRFQAGFASIAPLLNLLEGSDPKATKLIDVLVKLVGDVTSAFNAPLMALATPQIEMLIWVLRYADISKNALTVFGRVEPARAATPLLFPAINGVSPTGAPTPTPAAQAPDGQTGWMQVGYVFPDGVPKQLTMGITGLDLLVDQTVVGSARITRNADLGSTVNPLLVYETPEVSFSNVLVPYVEVTKTLGPASGPSMAQMLTSVLTPFVGAGETLGQNRIVRISSAYNYPLVTPTGGGAPLIATVPAILNAGEVLGADPAPLAQAFADALQQWGQVVSLPRAGASFSIAVSLFVNVASGGGVSRPVPLLTIDRIDLMTPAGWPGS